MELHRKLISESTDSYNIYTAYGYDDGSITISQQSIDAAETLKRSLFSHDSPVSSLSFSNSSNNIKLVSCSFCSVIIWSLANGKWKIKKEIKLQSECNTASFSSDDSKIALGMCNGKIEIRDANELNLIQVIDVEESGSIVSVFHEHELICGTEFGRIIRFDEEGNKKETKAFKNVPIIWLDCNDNNEIGFVCDDATILVYGSNGELSEVPFNKNVKPLRCQWNLITNSLTVIDDLGGKHDFLRLPNEEWKCF